MGKNDILKYLNICQFRGEVFHSWRWGLFRELVPKFSKKTLKNCWKNHLPQAISFGDMDSPKIHLRSSSHYACVQIITPHVQKCTWFFCRTSQIIWKSIFIKELQQSILLYIRKLWLFESWKLKIFTRLFLLDTLYIYIFFLQIFILLLFIFYYCH